MGKSLIITPISDTHMKTHNTIYEPCDILIHAGDATALGTYEEFEKFCRWMNKQTARYKIYVAGNHELELDGNGNWRMAILQLFKDNNIIYLENSMINIEGINIYGSPYSPTYRKWAFMKDPGEEITKIWDKIRLDADIVITHTPLYGILDTCPANEVYDENNKKILDDNGKPQMTDPHVGCKDLGPILDIVQPAVHICGHVHESSGYMKTDKTLYINASMVSGYYKTLKKKPHTFELIIEESQFKRKLSTRLIES